MNMYVILYHNKQDYHNQNHIVTICLTKEIAEIKVKEYEEQEALKKNPQKSYWIEDYKLDVGDLTIQENKNHIIIYT